MRIVSHGMHIACMNSRKQEHGRIWKRVQGLTGMWWWGLQASKSSVQHARFLPQTRSSPLQVGLGTGCPNSCERNSKGGTGGTELHGLEKFYCYVVMAGLWLEAVYTVKE